MLNGLDQVSVVIPVLNDWAALNALLRALTPFRDLEIVVVDDFSTDGTREILKKIQKNDQAIKIFFNEKNMGKGYSLRNGFTHSTGDIIIIQDADLEYEPIDIKKFINSISLYNADLVMGSRFIGDNRSVLYFC